MLPTLLKQIQALLIDKAYDAQAQVFDPWVKRQDKAVILPKSNRKQPREFDKDKYLRIYLIEKCFSKLKQYRGMASR